METQVRTPQMVFMQPQRLVVPLFQRPYVWNEENQWEPPWNDVVRVTDRVLNGPLESEELNSCEILIDLRLEPRLAGLFIFPMRRRPSRR